MAAPRASSVSTNTSVTYSSYTNLGIPPGIPSNRNGSSGGQIARFSLHVTASSAPSVAAGTSLRFVCRDADRVYWVKDAAISFATTIPRSGLDGASGNYIAQLTFPETASDKLDLLGASNGGDSNTANDAAWFVGLVGSTITNATGLTVYTTWSDQV